MAGTQIEALAPELESAKDRSEAVSDTDQVMLSDVACKQKNKLQTLFLANGFL
jgi:hypothetical protein